MGGRTRPEVRHRCCGRHLCSGALAGGAPYDLLVANILAGPLVALAPSFAAATAGHATIILSGLLREQADEVVAAYVAHGFAVERTIDHETGGADWRTLVLRR